MSPLIWVLGASVLVWGGLFGYLLAADARLRRLETTFSSGKSEEQDR
jgi:hypothetical protein